MTLSTKAIEKELRKNRGNISAAARAFRVTRGAIIYHVNKSAKLKQAVMDAREERVDCAESGLDKAIKAGEGWAICFTLKTQGKSRGYVERTEHRHGGDPENQTPITFIEASNGDNPTAGSEAGSDTAADSANPSR